MALLMHGRLRVTTSAGVPISGGKARVYNAGTTTLTTLYSDAALSTPLTNPVVASSDGWCAQIHAAEGTLVDIDYLTSADVIVKQDEDVIFVGASGSSWTRDFGSGGRAQIRGASDTVYFEGGSPTGDNTGGNVVISGWAGTTADSIDLNGPTDVSSDTFTVNGKKLPGVVQVAATTFSAVTNLDIPLTNSPSGVRAWEILIWDLALSVDDRLNGKISYDSGSNYKAGASDYGFHTVNFLKAAGSAFTFDAANGDFLLTTDELVDSAAQGVIRLHVVTPNSGAGNTVISSVVDAINGTTGGPGQWVSSIHGLGGYGRATNIRIYGGTNAATLTGKYRVTALRGTGES